MSGSHYDDYGVSDGRWRQIDWRRHLSWIELDRARVRYVDLGEGEPLLFVHGLGGRWQNWLENLPHFADRHRVIALDLPGFGASPMPGWQITMPAYGRMLVEFCDRLGLGPETVVVGNSMGGFIATEAVLESQRHFRAVALVSAAGITFARARNEPARVARRLTRLVRPLMVRYADSAITRSRLRAVAFSGVAYRPNRLSIEILWELAQGGLAPPGFGDCLVALAGYDARERLSEIELPTLIVWGKNDRIVPVRAALSYQRRIEDSSLAIFDRTGHVPMLERPGRFNRVLERFLLQHRTG